MAGIGNIFLGDDGFGPEVLRLAHPPRDRRIQLTDYGIGGLHLAYDLLDGVGTLVLVDALPDRGAPGTVHVFDADPRQRPPTGGLDAHAMDPWAVFAMLDALGGSPPSTVVIGCEVASVADGIGLSPAVAAAVPEAVAALDAVLTRVRQG